MGAGLRSSFTLRGRGSDGGGGGAAEAAPAAECARPPPPPPPPPPFPTSPLQLLPRLTSKVLSPHPRPPGRAAPPLRPRKSPTLRALLPGA